MSRTPNKPYRVYRQRRRRGDGAIDWSHLGGAPETRAGDSRRSPSSSGRRRNKAAQTQRGRGRTRRIMRRAKRPILIVLLLTLIGAAVWGGVAYTSLSSALDKAHKRMPADATRALSATDGPALSTPRNILLAGSDHRAKQVDDPGRTDSLMLVRIDVPKRRVSMLSIPRDLRANVPGYGMEKVNAAYSLGGPALTIKTVEELTGLPVHHYAEVDFAGFEQLIDRIGGITLNNPKAVISNEFDGHSWRYAQGELNLNGRRALAFARTRTNLRDASENDLERGGRQQLVIGAVKDRYTSPWLLWHPRLAPSAAVEPLTTDITASEFSAFALASLWAKDDRSLHCRLGGDAQYIGGSSYLVGGEENRAIVRMFIGDQKALPPDTKTNQFAGGCLPE